MQIIIFGFEPATSGHNSFDPDQTFPAWPGDNPTCIDWFTGLLFVRKCRVMAPAATAGTADRLTTFNFMFDYPTNAARIREDSPSPESQEVWFRTREGRRYGREIAAIVIVKLLLLCALWFVFINPWPRPATPPAGVVQQFYAPAAAAARHD
jgi:hypothetical protein